MPIRLAVADDHAIVLDGLEHILGVESDFEIVARCNGGREAIEAVRTKNPDVIVLDLRMPDVDGLSVMRVMRDERSTTKVVLLTAGLDEREVTEAIRMGVGGVVLKVMASRLLVQCIRKVHAGGQWIEKESVGRAIQKMLTTEDSMNRHARILSSRELDVIKMIGRGLRNKQIAEQLFISEATVKIHLHNIYSKLNLGSRVELSIYARDKGLI
jgi:DNA-binding NarL/FixJ family response regulator